MERGRPSRFRDAKALDDSFRDAKETGSEKSVVTPYDRSREEMEFDPGADITPLELAKAPEAPRRRAA